MTARRVVSQAEFARLRGVSRKTVTLWKRQERLLLTSDGMVDVAASDELLAQRAATYRGGTVKAKPAETEPAAAEEALPILDRAPRGDRIVLELDAGRGAAGNRSRTPNRRFQPRSRLNASVASVITPLALGMAPSVEGVEYRRCEHSV
jgi:hypothetical protein